MCSKKYPIYIVTEYITNGCLLNYLKSHGKGLEPSQLLEMCYDVCEGMAFLERHQFIHRDLVSKAIGSSKKGKKAIHSSRFQQWAIRRDGKEGIFTFTLPTYDLLKHMTVL